MIFPRKLSGDERSNNFGTIKNTFEPENDVSVSLSSPRVIKQFLESSFISELASFEQSYLNLNSNESFRRLDLPDSVLLMIMLYIGQYSFMKYKTLNKSWNSRIDLMLNNMCKPMEDGFNQQYKDYLTIKNKRFVFSPVEFSNYRGLRIDRILEIELKEKSPEVMYNAGRTFKMENIHKYLPDTAAYEKLRQSVVYRPTK
jgi:hypothetical protein